MASRFGRVAVLMALAAWSGSSAAWAGGRQAIHWRKPILNNGATIISGSVQTAHGTFQFHWVVSADGGARLATMVPFGAGELPPREMRLLPLVREDGSTLLFQEWFPLANVKEPATISVVAEVSTEELFSVLPPGKKPPATAIKKARRSIKWGAIREDFEAEYLPGRVKTSSGSLEILWRKIPGRLPELVTLEALGTGDSPPVEVRLYLWVSAGTTAICQEYPQMNQGFVPHLVCLAKVRSADLIAGFRRLAE